MPFSLSAFELVCLMAVEERTAIIEDYIFTTLQKGTTVISKKTDTRRYEKGESAVAQADSPIEATTSSSYPS